MATCPLCSGRSAKRFCPAKHTQICAVCCGTKREIEIDCPGYCEHLKAGRSYEAEKRAPGPDLVAKLHRFDDAFVHQFSPVVDAISRELVAERRNSPWLVDNDVIEVYKALRETMKTLSNGIHYESLPDGAVRQALFRTLRASLDQLMQPQPSADSRALRVSESVEVLDFLIFMVEMRSNLRPRSRRYLDWLTDMAEPPATLAQPGGLILP